jgi:plasmid stability protein
MAQLTVRKLDDRAYDRLKQRAERNKRSLEAEVRTILEEAAEQPGPEEVARHAREEAVKWAAEFRSRQAELPAGTTTRWLREDRDSH